MSEKTPTEFFEEGFRAFGDMINWKNPYEQGTDAHAEWHKGFIEAEDRFDQKCNEREEFDQIEWEQSPEGKIFAKLDEILAELKIISHHIKSSQ